MEGFAWSLIFQTFKRTAVHLFGDGIKLQLGDGGQVSLLGDVATKNTVEVFVGSFLPGRVGVTEVSLHPQIYLKFGVVEVLPAVVESGASSGLGW